MGIVKSGNVSVDCVFDPVDKKYVSICPSSSENTCEKSSSDMIYDELKRVFKDKLDKQFLVDEKNGENGSNYQNPENSESTESAENHDDENLDAVNSNWEVKIQIPKNFVIDDILRVIVAEIKKIEVIPETDEDTDEETESLLNEPDHESNFSKSNFFSKFSFNNFNSLLTAQHLGPEIVPLAVILIGSLVYS